MTALASPAITSRYAPAVSGGVDRAIRVSTAAVVLAVAGIAASISYWHAYAVVREYGETGVTARLELAQWFGPAGCSVPRDSIEIDARPGGRLRFVMTAPDVRSPVDATFTDVVENELLAGEMEAAGVPGVAGPLRVHLRLEFHDEGNGKTRLELRQGPFATGQLGADTRSGWESSFTKLDTLLRASLAPDLGTRRP